MLSQNVMQRWELGYIMWVLKVTLSEFRKQKEYWEQSGIKEGSGRSEFYREIRDTRTEIRDGKSKKPGEKLSGIDLEIS